MLSRELFWGIESGWVTYLLGALVIAILGYLYHFKIVRWRSGQEEKASINWKDQTLQLLRNMLSQRLLDDQKTWGIMHIFVFYGFIILFLGTCTLMIDSHIGHFLFGNTFVIFKLILNTAGLLAMIGIVLLFLRRYMLKTAKGENNIKTLLSLVLPFLVLITGFLVEGSRLAINTGDNYGWQFWAFPVYPVVKLVEPLGRDAATTAHVLSWWTHMFISFLTITALAWTKLSHIALVPLNLFHQALQAPGRLREIELSEDYFGTENLSGFTRTQLISIDACVSAGQCEINCPAFNSGKALSPRTIMEKMQKISNSETALVGDIITEEELWACTTCGACQQKCPVLSNPVEKIIDLRRYQVMALGNMPQTWQGALMSLQRRGHPWNAATRSRLDWAKGLDVPVAAEKKQFDVLFWVGCTGALIDRNIKVSQAIVKLLQYCGIDFAILGNEESCTCHMARRAGDEYLYQEMAEKNCSVLNQYAFNTIITACPHCYHTLKNEYALPDVQVLSHAVYLRELIEKGLLKIKTAAHPENTTYHDPCYYGRMNGIYEQPRELCKLAGANLIENEKSREKSFCCGGGGGGIWLDDKPGARIFETRAKQLLEKGNIETIATACPFCITMLETAVSNLEADNVKVKDIAELLANQIQDR
ncbi:succinate dehydrogenase/fumarate reductase iron-sulfur subunit [Pelotomaculum schinkii]|uniref:Succinate dehydrogenase/fumarate reductase iron-sulfur subunit n=1 Tax=Pelotomaculum schinkii TaxID=78350 RepID=A0A4Y7RBX0_9FIRM|nr:heterodisulfide reductase-related iron-sulfur binding cluster [Pelotomaculum schinkii]TEB06213.1 succinate dehydrogenase/fumarate reductase iron-sulfur subunit [Pelotomaculum schinkii]